MPQLPKIVTQSEFDEMLRSADRIEVIAVAFADGRLEQLPNNYYKHFERLKQAFYILLDEPVRRRAMKKMEELMGLQYQQVQKLLGDVGELFPQLEQSNREFERMMEINRVERLIEKIELGEERLVTEDEDGNELEEPKMMRVGGDVHSKSLPPLYKLLNELKGTKMTDDNRIPYEELTLPIPTFSTDITDMPGYKQADDAEWEEVPQAAE